MVWNDLCEHPVSYVIYSGWRCLPTIPLNCPEFHRMFLMLLHRVFGLLINHWGLQSVKFFSNDGHLSFIHIFQKMHIGAYLKRCVWFFLALIRIIEQTSWEVWPLPQHTHTQKLLCFCQNKYTVTLNSHFSASVPFARVVDLPYQCSKIMIFSLSSGWP